MLKHAETICYLEGSHCLLLLSPVSGFLLIEPVGRETYHVLRAFEMGASPRGWKGRDQKLVQVGSLVYFSLAGRVHSLNLLTQEQKDLAASANLFDLFVSKKKEVLLVHHLARN